jgi:hypothetical protein
MLFDFAENYMFALHGLAVCRLTNAAAPGLLPFLRPIRYESAPRMLRELGQVLINGLVVVNSRTVGPPPVASPTGCCAEVPARHQDRNAPYT